MSNIKETIQFEITASNDELMRKLLESRQAILDSSKVAANECTKIEGMFKRAALSEGALFTVKQAVSFAKQVAVVRGQFQQLEVVFQTMLGSKSKADALMVQMVDTAAKTPFDLQSVAGGAKQLLAYGSASEKVNEELIMLGNIASGLSIPLGDMVNLYGTTQVQGQLSMQDMHQFMEQGIPLADELAKQFGATTQRITEMVAEGRIGFPEVQRALQSMTGEGGKFHNQMEAQSKTITGQISNLGDAIDVMFNKIGQSQEGAISGVIGGATSVVENYEEILKILAPLEAAYGAYKAALIAIAAIQKLTLLTEQVKQYIEISKALGIATANQIAFNRATLVNPYVATAAALAAVVGGLMLFAMHTSDAERASQVLGLTIDEENDKLNKAYEAITKAKEGTEERKIAIDNFNQNYGKYLGNLLSEKSVVEDVAVAYNKAKAAVVDYAIEKARESYLSAPQSTVDETKTRFRLSASKWGEKLGDAAKSGSLMADIDKLVGRLEGGEVFSEGALYKTVEDIFAKQSGFKDNSYDALKTKEIAFELQREFGNLHIAKNEFNKFSQAYRAASVEVTDNSTQRITTVTQNLDAASKAFEKAQKELDDARSSDADKEVVGQKNMAVATARKNYDNALELMGIDPKAANRAANEYAKVQAEIADAQVRNLFDAEKEKIDAMADGRVKELAQIELTRKAKIAAIDQEETDLKAKYKGRELPKDQRNTYDARRTTAGVDATIQKAQVEAKYAKEIEALYIQLGNVWLTEEEKKRLETKRTYDGMREQLKRLNDGGAMSDGDYLSALWEVDMAEDHDNEGGVNEEKQAMNEYLAEYGNYWEKRQAIIDMYNDRISKATTEGEKLSLNKQMTKEVATLDSEAQKTTSIIAKLFDDMSNKSVADMRVITDEAEKVYAFLKSGEYDPNNAFGLTKEQFDLLSESPEELERIRAGIDGISAGADQAGTSFNKISKGLKNVFSAGSDNKKLKEGLVEVEEGMSDVMQAGQFLSDSLSSLGDAFGNDTLSDIATGINVAMDAMGSAMDGAKAGAAFGPWGAAAGAAIGMATSLASSLAKIHDAKSEKRIQELQGQIEVLEKSYDKLGDSVEKAYSQDASGLISQQNTMLEQQKVLIQQQIAAEKDKKKSDPAKIKEWEGQIDEINEIIDDNKEKALDAIFGEDLKSAIENFASAYANAWVKGEDRSKSAKETVRQMMRQMVTESIKAAIQSSEAMANIRKKLEEFYADGVLSEEEQNYMYGMAESLQKELDTKFGWADSLMKDDESENGREATKKGIATASQESVDENNGRLTAIQGYTFELNENIKALLPNISSMKDSIVFIRDNVAQQLEALLGIRNNTAPILDMRLEMSSMRADINSIVIHGVKIR